MRYCAHCGRIIDEYAFDRDNYNCGVCDAILLEDDMTALKYAELTEQEKDEYEHQLLNIIKNSVGFDEWCFQRHCSMDNGAFWRGFRPDKYLQVHKFKSEENKKFYLETRKKNEPFKPFPPIDKEKARQYTHDSVELMKQIEEKNSSNNVPKCPSCGSSNVSKIGVVNRVVSTTMLGLASSKIGKTHKCSNCGTTW